MKSSHRHPVPGDTNTPAPTDDGSPEAAYDRLTAVLARKAACALPRAVVKAVGDAGLSAPLRRDLLDVLAHGADLPVDDLLTIAEIGVRVYRGELDAECRRVFAGASPAVLLAAVDR